MSPGKPHTPNDAKRRGVDRQISFSIVSSPDTPLRPLTPSLTAAGWTTELEERLRYVQSQMEAHQRRWSAGQEDYLEEVEALLEMKRRFKTFVRRRSKDHKREGKSLERAAETGAIDPETGLEMTTSIGPLRRDTLSCIPRRLSSRKSTRVGQRRDTAPDPAFSGANEGGKTAKATGRRRDFFRLPMRWRKGGRPVRNRST